MGCERANQRARQLVAHLPSDRRMTLTLRRTLHEYSNLKAGTSRLRLLYENVGLEVRISVRAQYFGNADHNRYPLSFALGLENNNII